MLYFVVVLSLLSVAYTEGDERPKINVPPQVHKAIKDAAAECIKVTKVKQEVSDNFFSLKLEIDEETKKFTYCLCRKMNYADEDGHILTHKLMPLLEGSDHKEDVKKVIDNCNDIKEKDKMETFFQALICIYNNTPLLVSP